MKRSVTCSTITRKALAALVALLLLITASAFAEEPDYFSEDADGAASILVSENDLLGLIESQLPEVIFTDMSEDRISSVTDKLGSWITDAYRFTGRITENGQQGYLIGICINESSPLQGTGSQSVYSDGEEYHEIISNGAVLHRYANVYMDYHPEHPEIIYLTLHPEDATQYAPIFNLLLNDSFDYLQGAATRGVLITAPSVPYLDVKMYRNGVYCREYIPLTEDDLFRAAASSYVYSPKEIGDYAIRLIQEGDDPDEYTNALVPAPLVELAQEKCGFDFSSPETIGDIVSASMTVSTAQGSCTQDITDSQQLAKLEDMLKAAKPSMMGKCPYTGVLKLIMADGSTLTLQKATDSCDGILFGSMCHYEIGNKENDVFWEIFADIYDFVIRRE